MTAPIAAREVWCGLACTHISLPNGDSVRVSDFGAQVLSWSTQGHERLFLSERAVLDGSAAIRGGVPVCFPQFNQRGPLPKHGIARCTTWQWQADALQIDAASSTVNACWRWEAAAPLHPDFPHALRAQLMVTVSPGHLTIALSVTNTGETACAFTAALHSYLAVQGGDIAALAGLEHAAYWDAARNFAPAVQVGGVVLGEEVDRVYTRPIAPLLLRDAAGSLKIDQDAGWSETVVWNPGPDLCAQLPDMQPVDWMRMLCVEAAAINQPVALLPGQHWHAAQYLSVA